MKFEDPNVAQTIPPTIPPIQTTHEGYFEITELPSKYKLYPENTVISAKPLNVLQIKELSTINDVNAMSVINKILTKSIRGINVQDLLVVDKVFLIFWLRNNTYQDSGYTVKFDCVQCETEANYEFSLDCLNINDIKDNYDPDKNIVFKHGTSKNDTVKMSQLRVKDENNVVNFLTKNRNALAKFNEELLGIANLLSEINGEEMSLMQKYEYLLSINPLDYTYLESYIKTYEIGINPVMDVKCSNCGGTAPVAVSFRREFFIPTAPIE